jgi:cytosine deaminase
MDNYYVSKLLPLMAEAQVAAIANPLINIVVHGRHDSYPKLRGQTRVPEMREHDIAIAFGHDCVMDPWYSLGQGDMLEVGCNADMVVLQAADAIEAIRLKATRRALIRRGRVIAETPDKVTRLDLAGRPRTVDPADYAPVAG